MFWQAEHKFLVGKNLCSRFDDAMNKLCDIHGIHIRNHDFRKMHKMRKKSMIFHTLSQSEVV